MKACSPLPALPIISKSGAAGARPCCQRWLEPSPCPSAPGEISAPRTLAEAPCSPAHDSAALACRPSQPCLASANPGQQRPPACPADPAIHAGTAGRAGRIGAYLLGYPMHASRYLMRACAPLPALPIISKSGAAGARPCCQRWLEPSPCPSAAGAISAPRSLATEPHRSPATGSGSSLATGTSCAG